MKKVFLSYKLNEEEKKRIESISDQYEIIYEPDTEAEVVIGNYSPKRLSEYKNLKWLQTSAIGVDNYIKPGILQPDTVLTNAVGIHTQEVAEHILAMMLNMLKNMYLYRDNQSEKIWNDEGVVKSYKDLKVTIVGFGDIGNYLARMLKALGMYVIGVKRTMIEKPEYIDELYLQNDLNKAISNVDVVVSILPGNLENKYLFTLDTFKAMDKDTIYINAGRGNLYTEETLFEVLDKKIIKAIGLDVFEKEPLDPENKLWTYKNVFITPHVAGFFHLHSAHEAFVDLIEENLRRYINNEELKFIVKERD